jgi:hypothetical protein
MLDRFERVFNGDGGDYTFTMSGVAISGMDVEQRFEKGQWVLTQRQDSREWTARSASHVGAVLLLIAARWGLSIDGDFKEVTE